MDNDTMRGLFFIMKGQYKDKCEPSYINKVTGDVNYIGGFDPDREETKEWYMLYDRKCFYCLACGEDFNRVLNSVKTQILRFKGRAKNYFYYLGQVTYDNYYKAHYLDHQDITQDEGGKRSYISSIEKSLHEEVFKTYGDYYADEIEKVENEAYKELAENSPLMKMNKGKRSLKRPIKVVVQTPDTKEQTPIKVTDLKKGIKTPKVFNKTEL